MKYKILFILLLTLSFFTSHASAEPAKKESIKLLMEKTGAGDIGKQMLNQMIPALKSMIPNAPENFWKDMMQEINSEQMIDLIIPVYQKHLSEKDVRAINAFYDTNAGKKLISAQPLIMQESMILGQQWGREIAGNIIEKYKIQTETDQKKTAPAN